MNIVHIAPSATYNEGWSYQENLLPKYQKKLDNEVTLITTNMEHRDGTIVEVECYDKVTEDGFRVVRKKIIPSKIKQFKNIFSYIDIYDLLVMLHPDLIFYHGLGTKTIFQAIRYKKKLNPNCVIVQDNHLDYNIGFTLNILKERIVKALVRGIQKKCDPYIAKVYGVTPWRKTYAESFYKVNRKKTDVLIMGADDEEIHFEQRNTIRKAIRDKYKIKSDEFLIVSGGRIDEKKKIHLLMEAVNHLNDVKLIVFGNVQNDISKEFCAQLSDKIIHVGFIESKDVYSYFFAADLVFFPGQHSVLWEQACAAKVPCVFAKWEGMDHVNNGGNSDFISSITVESIENKIIELQFTDKYYDMKSVAESEMTDIYLYSKIAEKSLECVPKC